MSVNPNRAGNCRITEVAKPDVVSDAALIQVLSVGLCGTDRELLGGEYGEAPPGYDHLIIGHESLGRVVATPGGPVSPGDLVVAIVRRPDPQPCSNCAAGEWDMCLNGLYTEHGIKAAHGFLTEFYAESPQYLVRLPERFIKVGMLLEPLSIIEKAVEQIKRTQSRLLWAPKKALVFGAGTIGLFAALLLRLDGLTVYLYSRGDGGQGKAVGESAGAQFFSSDKYTIDALRREIGSVDIVIEATGYSPYAFEAMHLVGPNGIVCLTGVSAGSRRLTIDASHLNLEMVLENKVVFGTVNANRRHFESGVAHLDAIEARWPGLLERMITRRVPLEGLNAGVLDQPGGLKVVVDIA